ncbi:hypothetical protein ABEB36_008864 [Hypothenemus hampei]
MGQNIIQKNRFFLTLVACVLTTIYFFVYKNPEQIESKSNFYLSAYPSLSRKEIDVWMTNRQLLLTNLSKLGEVLFLNVSEPEAIDKRYEILIWKYGYTIENRHLKQYSHKRIDPFEYCPVKNCDLRFSDKSISTADIVIFHLHRIKGVDDLPKRQDSKQIWAFLTDESPYNTFLQSKNNTLKNYNGLFNWSMTYRSDSDIPVPYGRTVLKKWPIKRQNQIYEKKLDVLVAILGSNCGGQNHRWDYVKQLQKFIQVDVYGGCGPFKKSCPGHFKSDCPAIENYIFYLSFENSNCNEYITEKLWWNAYAKNSIPIVMGSSQTTYKALLPPGSYINTEDYANPNALAYHILSLNKSGEYRKYYRWQEKFQVLNEHGYFGSKSYHYCRICQAVNYNNKDHKVYNDLESYWSVKRDCHSSWDA